MSAELYRTMSVKQTAMAATALPLEIQQQIFNYLDTRSFYSARKVCRYWSFAATASDTLRKQLRRMPVLPSDDAQEAEPVDLQSAFNKAARCLMYGISTERAHDTPASLTKGSKMGFPVSPRVIATPDGNTLVTLNGRQISLYDTSNQSPRLKARRSLNDLKETVGSGPWLKVNSNTYNEMALSSNGSLLAVAQERTIQIYDLNADPDSFTVNEYVASATGHYICGIDFEQNDHLLRVRLSGKGTVVYLGTPAPAGKEEQPADLEHWKSKAGLRHVFLDSSLLLARAGEVGTSDPTKRVSGVQLLGAFEQGYLFAGQQHGGGESSHYILGHVQTTTAHNFGIMTTQPETVCILARLESFLSSWKYTLEASTEGGLGGWENMPSAHEHHPRFAITTGGCFDFLALAERDKKRIRPAPLTQLFLYRIPAPSQLRSMIAAHKQSYARKAGSSDDMDWSVAETGKPTRTFFDVPRIPLCLTTVENDVTDLGFSVIDDRTCALSASTKETTRTWRIHER
ncbi:hypothetical protein CB0940_01178 [Cercospora beticola]|uniref:F-box domain-containing protein n=1 Tax=Cercospora beticola TaxID=122368 RepID=A0A2G5I9Q4_CERBT|nr:hypothetical protein CB0940_01178 [Cercospora beticola]PIB01442.1 hypothetical protein CB0940_01178 [Cercospora beticola]WPA96607.1 hypothetical protein RHO25_001214 [Cercospora beticola]CAK1355052.1 unnamed protein product [Cercospora beticola]